MSELIPAFDWHTVIVQPWSGGSAGIALWTVLMGFLVAATCGLVGNYLILRRMALVGDAISHSVLIGIAGAFLVASAVAKALGHGDEAASNGVSFPGAMFVGALLAAFLTTILIEVIHKRTRVKQDAAIGIAFSSLFAIGVILISLFADKVHLDTDCVLYGEIGFVPFEPFFQIGDQAIAPQPVVRMGVVAVITLLLIVLCYKELLVSSFDSGLAASLGINASLVHYALMGWLSIVVVSAFESVGAILVIAMLIIPGATAHLLSKRLSRILWLTVGHAFLTALLGFHLAIWLGCATAGAMGMAASGLFFLAWLFAPEEGMVAKWRRNRRKVRLEEVAEAM